MQTMIAVEFAFLKDEFNFEFVYQLLGLNLFIIFCLPLFLTYS